MWKVVGVIESRSGDVEFLPEWTIGTPNEFSSKADAEAVRQAMQAQIEHMRIERLQAAPGAGGAGPSIRYIILPAIDQFLISQLHGGDPVRQPAKPQTPALTFSTQPTPGQ